MDQNFYVPLDDSFYKECNHFIDKWNQRPKVMDKIQRALQKSGVCLVSGPGSVGKSTIAALFAHKRRKTPKIKALVWWLPCDNGSILRSAVEMLARKRGIDPYKMCRRLAGDHPTYRQ